MTFRALAIFVAISGLVKAEPALLTEGDRQALIEKLKSLQEGAGGRAEKRAGTALAAFRAAVSSDDKTHDLYLNCVEKVRFEDEKKSGQDFRDWKRRHKEREDSPEFRRALRHQLVWLLLAMEAQGASKDDADALGKKAVTTIDAILADKASLEGQLRLLEQDATKTVFALAYSVSLDSPWPSSPLKLSDVYQKAILPPLKAKKEVEAFRAAWTKWVLQEALLLEMKSAGPEKGERSAAFERFLVEKRPQMLWDLEKEVFAMGDQRSAALAMLAHLETFAGNQSEIKWTQEFTEMLEPQLPEPELEEVEPGS